MTIPPVGSPVSPASPPDDRANGNSRKADPPDNADVDRARPRRTENVELSPEASRIRDRQAEITRLQVADRAADVFRRDALEAQRLSRELSEAAHDKSGEARKRLEAHMRETREHRNAARYRDENLFDGREMKVRIEGREETVRMPDSDREFERLDKEVRRASAEKRPARVREQIDDTERFQNRAREVRKRLERDVRESVEGAVRESSTARPRDVQDAERLIRQARANRREDRPPGMEQISHRAVNLLQ